MKTITFAVPCYNSAAYMDKCIGSLLECGRKVSCIDDIEILIVDDGSEADNTAEKADEWAKRYPGAIRALHQENGGHGAAINTALATAGGLYFKVVDSDDWLDAEAMEQVMEYLLRQSCQDSPSSATDMVVSNYVYEKVSEGKSVSMGYGNVLPEGIQFGWDEVGSFGKSQYLLMHSVIYRTELLRQIGFELPRHCFYVDNIFVYVPLPHVKTMYYLNVDAYRYFIGREGQSVNEKTMMERIDQQLRITRIMVDSADVASIKSRQLRRYMENYLSIMYTICTVFLRMKDTPEDNEKLIGIWRYLSRKSKPLYRRVRLNVLNVATNMPTRLGQRICIDGYHIAQRLFKFN